MLKIYYLRELLLASITLSIITCAIIQRTKAFLTNSKFIIIYSFIINILVGILFSISFTDIKFPDSLWVGLFSFLGADSIYKSFEGKITSYTNLRNKKISTNEVDKRKSS